MCVCGGGVSRNLGDSAYLDPRRLPLSLKRIYSPMTPGLDMVLGIHTMMETVVMAENTRSIESQNIWVQVSSFPLVGSITCKKNLNVFNSAFFHLYTWGII